MPGFDGTGPAGSGPMTGGARGWCNPYPLRPTAYDAYRPILRGVGYPRQTYGATRPFWGRGPGFGSRRRGLGWGRGRGMGRGRGWRW
jgi:hypothetical protein